MKHEEDFSISALLIVYGIVLIVGGGVLSYGMLVLENYTYRIIPIAIMVGSAVLILIGIGIETYEDKKYKSNQRS